MPLLASGYWRFPKQYKYLVNSLTDLAISYKTCMLEWHCSSQNVNNLIWIKSPHDDSVLQYAPRPVVEWRFIVSCKVTVFRHWTLKSTSDHFASNENKAVTILGHSLPCASDRSQPLKTRFVKNKCDHYKPIWQKDHPYIHTTVYINCKGMVPWNMLVLGPWT